MAEAILYLQIFDKLKSEQPTCLRKVEIIRGDCLKPNLGISDKERIILQAEVNVVFHVAATVRFDAPLRTAVNINVRSTRDLLDIAKNMCKLKVYIVLQG